MNRIPEHAPFKTITKVFFTHKPEKLSVESGPSKVSLLHAQQEKVLFRLILILGNIPFGLETHI